MSQILNGLRRDLSAEGIPKSIKDIGEVENGNRSKGQKGSFNTHFTNIRCKTKKVRHK